MMKLILALCLCAAILPSQAAPLISNEEAGAVLDSYAVSPKHGQQLFPEAQFLNNSGMASYLTFSHDLVFYRIVAVPETVVGYSNQFITHVYLSDLNDNPLDERLFNLWVDRNLRKDRNFNVSVDSSDFRWAIIVSDEPINQILATDVDQHFVLDK